MTTPRAILSGRNGAVELSDGGVHAEIGYLAPYAGLMEPAGHPMGASIATFDGVVRVQPQATHFVPRSFTLDPCYLVGGNGLAELQRRMHDFWEIVKGRPSKIQIGSLELKVNLDPPKYKQRFESTKRLEFMLSGEALPALWLGMYGYAVGTSQSIVVVDDRLDHTSLKFTPLDAAVGNVFTLANPGTAPTSVALMLSGLTASTTYYLRNMDQDTGRRVAFTTAASGSTSTAWFLPAAAGLVLVPGTNTIRVEASAGTLITPASAFKVAIVPYQTTWQFLGNEADRFNEGPVVLHHYRRGLGTYHTAAGTLTEAGNIAARIGVPVGDWTAALAGLVLEGSITNQFTQSELLSHADWLTAGAPTFASSATLLPNGGTAQEVTDTGGATAQGPYQTKTSANAEIWTVSGWIKKEAVGGLYPCLFMDYTVGTTPIRVDAIVDTNAGTAVIYSTTGHTGTAKVYSAGTSYWRVTLTVANNSTGNTSITAGFRPAASTDGTTSSDAATGTKTGGGLQLEKLPFGSSYSKTTTAAVTRNADQLGVCLPHNYLKDSRDITTSNWTLDGSATRTGNTTAGPDGTTTVDELTLTTGATDGIYQAVTPDIRPSSTAWTVVGTFLKGNITSTDSVNLRLDNQAGTNIAAQQISASDFPDTTNALTFYVTGTPAAAATAIRASIYVNSLAGTRTIKPVALGLYRGSFPGPVVMTESSNIPIPSNGYSWPTWLTQNGYVEFKALLPPISTGLTYYLFGDSTFGIYRDTAAGTGSNQLKVVKTGANGSTTVTVANASNVWDGALHTFRIEWLNFTRSGTQFMYLRLYVDGVLKSSDSDLSSLGSWSTPDRLLFSSGSVYATIRNVAIGVPTWTTGDTPAAVTV